MRAPAKKAIASASSIAIIIALTALMTLWAAPRFGLNIKTQVVIFALIISIVKTAYFLAVELNEESSGGDPRLKRDAEAEANGTNTKN